MYNYKFTSSGHIGILFIRLQDFILLNIVTNEATRFTSYISTDI